VADARSVLQEVARADPEARNRFAIALSEAVEAVLQGVDTEFQGTIEQFRLAGDTAEVAAAAELAKSAARETEPGQTSLHENAMTVLAAFLKPGGLRPTQMADVRSLAREGDGLRGRGGLTGLEH